MKCPSCGSDNIEGAAYCEDCGAKLAAGTVATMTEGAAPPPPPPPPPAATGGTVQCGACGAKNEAGEAYCSDCGAALGVATAVSAEATAPPPGLPPQGGGEGAVVPSLKARLVVTATNKEFPLEKEVVLVGRQSPADGVFPDVDLTEEDKDAYISRKHAQFSLKDDQYALEDLGSSNGTFVNNMRLSKGAPQPLNSGDKIRVGKLEMVYTVVT
ncbi:MAG: FHA domain-containing protein [Armatimonadetes bacterium]|nr:FHA domain-containing protein [Armatimonadota bacterium]